MMTEGEINTFAPALGRLLGSPMRVVPDTLFFEEDYTHVTIASASDGSATVKFLARVFVNNAAGEEATWALVFCYIGGQRVAPKGACYLVCHRQADGEWRLGAWEEDEWGEWAHLDGGGQDPVLAELLHKP